MHIPVLGFIGTAARTLWDKLRGRPTGQADRGALAAGGDQTINAPVATGSSVVATDQAAAMMASGGGTNVYAPGATINNIYNVYIDGLNTAPTPTRDHFQEGQQLQEAERHDAAIEEFQAAFVDADTDGHRGALHLLIGISHAIRGRPSQAEGSFNEALRLFQSARDNTGQAAALGNLGIVYGQRNGPGDLHKAENYLQQALEIQRQIGDRLGEANQLTNLGNVYVLHGGPGDLDKAEEHHQQALQIHREIGNRRGEAQDHGNLGIVYLKSGDLGKAERHEKRSAAMHRKLGSRFNEAQAIFSLGIVSLQRGDTRTTREYIEQAQTIFQAIGAAAHAEGARWLLEELERQQQDRGE